MLKEMIIAHPWPVYILAVIGILAICFAIAFAWHVVSTDKKHTQQEIEACNEE